MKNRKRNRLKGYDYSKNNLYFVTICVKNNLCCLGEVIRVGTGRDLSVHHPENHYRDNHHPENHHPENHHPENHPSENHHPENHHPENHHPENHYRDNHHPENHHPENHHPENHHPDNHPSDNHPSENHPSENHYPDNNHPENHHAENHHAENHHAENRHPGNQNYIMQLNEYGLIVEERILWLEQQYPYVEIHNHQVMPNHFHLILEIDSLKVKDLEIKIKSLSSLIGAMKTTSSKLIHDTNFIDFAWHRSFHDHIINNEQSYRNIYNYISNNPVNWYKDCFYKKG